MDSVLKAALPYKSSYGLSVKKLNKIPDRIRCKLYTAYLILLDSRTIFILKKKKNTSIPAALWPLSIASTLLCQFHKILVHRFLKCLESKSNIGWIPVWILSCRRYFKSCAPIWPCHPRSLLFIPFYLCGSTWYGKSLWLSWPRCNSSIIKRCRCVPYYY